MRKRRNYKKVLLAVISAVLCLITAFGLTACGKKDGSDGDGGTKVSDKEWQKRLSWEDCESYTYETWNNIPLNLNRIRPFRLLTTLTSSIRSI